MRYTRRDIGKIALAGLPVAAALARPNSRINGVRIGAISYSFRSLTDLDQILKAYVEVGFGEAELMSNHAEAAAGAPAGGGRGQGRGPGAAPAGVPGAPAPQGRRGEEAVAVPPLELPALPWPRKRLPLPAGVAQVRLDGPIQSHPREVQRCRDRHQARVLQHEPGHHRRRNRVRLPDGQGPRRRCHILDHPGDRFEARRAFRR